MNHNKRTGRFLAVILSCALAFTMAVSAAAMRAYAEPLTASSSIPLSDVAPVQDAKVYISNYEVVDYNGNRLARVVPGDKVIIAVTVVDERINADAQSRIFPNTPGAETSRVHVNMSQGAFSLTSSSSIIVKLRNPVSVPGGSYTASSMSEESTVTSVVTSSYNALCYTIQFRDVTYVGGDPTFTFGVSYTDSGNNPLSGRPYTGDMQVTVNQATDDIPAPNIILNSASYGKTAIVGEAFNLVTQATNTSDMLELDNVSVKVELPQGLNMASGNSQVLIGHVGKKGAINHTFSLKADGVSTEVTSLPVKLVYTFEAVVGGKRTRFTSEQEISVNIQQPLRFSIQNINYDEQMYSGNSAYLSVSLVNKGKTPVYNVNAEIVSDFFTGWETEFLGTVNSGETSDAEFDLMATDMGTGTGKVVISYEDGAGTVYTLEEEFAIDVVEMPEYNEPGFDKPIEAPEEKSGVMPYIIGGIVLLAAAGGGFYFYKKKKAKRRAELEEDDEDI